MLEPLESMLEAKDVYGLLVMDGREATIATLKGKNTNIIRQLHSTAHSKTRMGGQSARRYERLIEEGIELYYKRIGEALDTIFVGMENFRGIIVGGPGPAKEDFAKMAPFNYQLKILGVLDTGYTEEYGVQELTNKADSVISQQEAIKEKQLVDRFVKEVVTGGLVTYGEREVKEALDSNRVKTLLMSEGLDLKRVKFKCSKCGKEVEKMLRTPAEYDDDCNGKMRIVETVDATEELLNAAEAKEIAIEMISTDTAEGAQFLNSFFGIGAFLRY